MKKVKILGVQFDSVTLEEACARVMNLLERNRGGSYIVTPNPEMLLEAQKNTVFRDTLNRAALSIPDGMGILWASSYLHGVQKHKSLPLRQLFIGIITLASIVVHPRGIKKIMPERVTGVDLMTRICQIGRKNGYKFFLLGAASGIAEKTASEVAKRFPGVNIAGTYAGSPSDDDFPEIQKRIETAAPDVLFVAFGAPAQELWISKHLVKLSSVKVAMGVGGSFDFLAGSKKRAPAWMRSLGLEWAYRLAKEPSRLQRIINATVRFPYRVIKG